MIGYSAFYAVPSGQIVSIAPRSLVAGEARRLYYKTPGPSLERMETLASITLFAKSSKRKCSYFLIAMTFTQTGCQVKQVISRCTRVTASLTGNGYLPGKSGDDVS